MSNLDIAHTIMNQLGGFRRLGMMAGAKDFVAIENGVQFKIGRNAKRINMVRITLNGLDLYNVEFGYVTKYNGTPSFKVKSKIDDVYNDMLVNLFESNTGMYLTL